MCCSWVGRVVCHNGYRVAIDGYWVMFFFIFVLCVLLQINSLSFMCFVANANQLNFFVVRFNANNELFNVFCGKHHLGKLILFCFCSSLLVCCAIDNELLFVCFVIMLTEYFILFFWFYFFLFLWEEEDYLGFFFSFLLGWFAAKKSVEKYFF